MVPVTRCAAFEESGFEVVSIRPAAESSGMALRLHQMTWESSNSLYRLLPGSGRNVNLNDITLTQLIAVAYRIRTQQVIGRGLDGRMFDIKALLPEGATREGANERLKIVLKERFALRAHQETRNESGFVLTVRPGGPNLKATDPAAKRSGTDLADLLAARREVLPKGASRTWTQDCTMAALADILALQLGMPVADRTGLAGKYDVVLDVAPTEDPQGLDREARIIEAVRKLGLDLKKGTVPVDVVVVDSVSKTPTGN
jgi:uncharacterized protein (TIGR03435 family)